VYRERPPVRNVATGLTSGELDLPRSAIERHDPELAYLIVDQDHELTLEENGRLVEAITQELLQGELDGRGFAYDDLIGRVNVGPSLP
jgi:hypothetical protein